MPDAWASLPPRRVAVDEHVYARHGRRGWVADDARSDIRKSDADCLRMAARILSTRTRRKTFALLVIIRVLQWFADKIEDGKGRDR